MPEFPVMNLPNALDIEVQGIDQLLRNVAYLYGYQRWLSGPAWGNYHHEWPEPDRIRYRMGDERNAVWMELRNVHVTDYGPIEWQDAIAVGGRHTDIVEEQEVKIPVDEGKWTKTVSLTFEAVRGLEDQTKQAFTSEAEARLGGISSPAGAKLNQKVELEFAQKFSKVNTERYTVTDTIELPTPLHITYRGERARIVEERRTRSRPRFDYGIALRFEFNEGSWSEMYFASKDQFLDFIRGNADDTVGVYRVGGLTTRGAFGAVVAVPSPPDEPQAAFFRDHPQPDATIPDTDHALEWVATYDNAAQGRLVVIDHNATADGASE